MTKFKELEEKLRLQEETNAKLQEEIKAKDEQFQAKIRNLDDQNKNQKLLIGKIISSSNKAQRNSKIQRKDEKYK